MTSTITQAATALAVDQQEVPEAPHHDDWELNAKRWSGVAHPLKPDEEDLGNMRRALGGRGGRGLILGVTQALLDDIDPGLAVDLSEAMIAGVSRPHRVPILQADWRSLPVADASFDYAIGDGSLNATAFPDDYRDILGELRRVLIAPAIAVLRFFATPEDGETPQAVVTDALAGRIRNFHTFKFRLAQALVSRRGDPNIPVREVHAALLELVADRRNFAGATGWHPQTIETIESYRGSTAVYSFPTLAELRSVTVSLGWHEVSFLTGSYQLGERYPVIGLQQRS